MVPSSKTNMAMLNKKSPFLIGDTCSNGCFFDSQSLVLGGYGKHWIVLKEGKKKSWWWL